MAKKPKRPHAPKASANYQTWLNYQARINEWKRKCNQIVTDKKKKIALIQKLRRVA